MTSSWVRQKYVVKREYVAGAFDEGEEVVFPLALLLLEARLNEVGADGGLEIEVEALFEDADCFTWRHLQALALDQQQCSFE